MQAAYGRVRGPCAPRAVLFENTSEAIRVLRKVLKRHGAVFDERYGFPVAFHRHHDVQARFAHLPHVALKRLVRLEMERRRVIVESATELDQPSRDRIISGESTGAYMISETITGPTRGAELVLPSVFVAWETIARFVWLLT